MISISDSSGLRFEVPAADAKDVPVARGDSPSGGFNQEATNRLLLRRERHFLRPHACAQQLAWFWKPRVGLANEWNQTNK
uniref:Uncharacterized protein n=1 Tax=Peronospora matthiolae TaxID=2874970 RepID=A0AAV1UW48_9STRA